MPAFHSASVTGEYSAVGASSASPYQRDSIGIHFTWKKVDAVYEMVKVVEAVLAPFKYRPHLGKVFSASPQYLASVMPKLADFRKLINEIDPTNKFGNDFTDKLLGR